MAKSTQMQPAEEELEFQLEAPDETPLVVHKPKATAKKIKEVLTSKDKPHKAGSQVKLSAEKIENVTNEVDGLMQHLKNAEVGSDEIQSIQDFVRTLGSAEINKENVSSSLMEKSLGQLQKNSQGAEVASALIDLRNLVEELDPNATKNLGSKLLRKLPLIGKKLDNKAKSFQSSQTQVDDIVKSLEAGKKSLQEDNEAIKIERKNLWGKMGTLEEYILATEQLSARLKEILPEVAATDPVKAKLIQTDILFYVEQRHMDLLTNLAVSMQAYMALDVVSKNNIELIKGVDRATTTTIQALKVAVMLAQALTNQQVVVEKLGAVNEITERLLEGVSTALNETGVKIATGAMSSSVKPETLKRAFDQVIQAMDNIENYRSDALVVMEQTIKELSETTAGMKRHLDVHKEKELSGISKTIADKRNNGISLNPTKKLGV